VGLEGAVTPFRYTALGCMRHGLMPYTIPDPR
jgi:hypothetical protein